MESLRLRIKCDGNVLYYVLSRMEWTLVSFFPFLWFVNKWFISETVRCENYTCDKWIQCGLMNLKNLIGLPYEWLTFKALCKESKLILIMEKNLQFSKCKFCLCKFETPENCNCISTLQNNNQCTHTYPSSMKTIFYFIPIDVVERRWWFF